MPITGNAAHGKLFLSNTINQIISKDEISVGAWARRRLTPENMKFMRNRGHGTGTLSLLAGNKLDRKSPGWASFTSGDHHQSRVICEVVALPSPRLHQ